MCTVKAKKYKEGSVKELIDHCSNLQGCAFQKILLLFLKIIVLLVVCKWTLQNLYSMPLEYTYGKRDSF